MGNVGAERRNELHRRKWNENNSRFRCMAVRLPMRKFANTWSALRWFNHIVDTSGSNLHTWTAIETKIIGLCQVGASVEIEQRLRRGKDDYRGAVVLE